MSFLPDVNVLLAYGWQQHPDHSEVSAWLEGVEAFSLCPITELGFVRISMSPAFRASHGTANKVLAYIGKRDGASHIPCDLAVAEISQVTSYKDTTDAYLVDLAKHRSLKLATLDQGILNKPWATGVAFDPTAG